LALVIEEKNDQVQLIVTGKERGYLLYATVTRFAAGIAVTNMLVTRRATIRKGIRFIMSGLLPTLNRL
jgi:hypothetical protein